MAGPKRMRLPQQQQSGSNSPAYQQPSTEIALQQQLLKQQHGESCAVTAGILARG